jgi:methyltransferase (TIGR00027 family)
MDVDELESERSAVPFTSRLIAYHRAMESVRENPLILDPFAARLAGDLDSYLRNHRHTGSTSDYTVVRTRFIDEHVLGPWCVREIESQIVLLGAGLDARAYRFDALSENNHTMFEVDYDTVNAYKSKILSDEKPLCKLVRVSANLSEPSWVAKLEMAGLRRETPTLWILEGLVYYIDQEIVLSILKAAATVCGVGSEIFADVCAPGLTLAEFGPFLKHFRWGLEKSAVSPFFARCGWSVMCDYADEHDHGRDVGQRGLMFVVGKRDFSRLVKSQAFVKSPDSVRIPKHDLQSFSSEFLTNIAPEIEAIARSYKKRPHAGLVLFLEFMERRRSTIQNIIESYDNLHAIGHISSRLLRDPNTTAPQSPEEEEAHIAGYLTGIVLLLYCIKEGLEAWQFTNSDLYQKSLAIHGKIDGLSSLIQIVIDELNEHS